MTQSEETFTFVDKRRATDLETSAPEAEGSSAADAVFESEAGGEEPSATIYDMGLYCAGLFASEAWQRMGLIVDQATGKAVADLPQARIAIDLTAALVEVLDASDSSLPQPVRQDLRRTLNDLRLNFVEQSRRAFS